MSISRVGAPNTASATSVTVPTHQAGDLILIWALRSGSTTFASVPAGYLPIVQKSNATATTLCAIAGYKIASSSSDTSGTWTNASQLICAVYRPSAGNTIRIGQGNVSSSTTATVAFPTLSPMGDSTSGQSWVVGLVSASNTTQTLTVAPAGMTNESNPVGATFQSALHDTEGGVSSWTSTNANVVGTGNTVSATIELVLAPGPNASIPNVYHHIGGGGLQATRALSGNGFKCPVLNPSGVGNSILIGFTCTGGATVSSVTGSVNGAYTQVNTALGGTGNLDSYVYLLQNCANGTETITVTFSATVATFQYVITEFYGVATGGGNNGTSKNAYSATLGAPSFTPTNNNANGGNIIWVYSCKAETDPNQFVSGVFPVSPFNFLTADTADSGSSPQINTSNSPANSLPKVAMAYLQATSAAIAPTFVSVNEPAGDHWNTIAVALPISAGAGSAPTSGIFIHGIQHLSSTYWPIAAPFGTWGMQVCASGNLRVIQSDDPSLGTSGGGNPLVVTDSEGNTWTGDTAGVGAWWLANAQPNPNLTIFITGGGGDNELSWRFFDISGAAPAPFVGALGNVQDVHGLTSFTAAPSPNPVNNNGLMIAALGLGDGPGLGVTAPTGAVWDFCTYTGELDTDTIENADILAHYYYFVTGSQTWTFSITNRGTNSTSGGFIWFAAGSGFQGSVDDPPMSRVRGMRLGTPMSRLRGLESSPVVLNPNITVTLVGQAASFTAGTVVPNNTDALTGQAAIFTAGTLTPNFSLPLTGQLATFTAGTLGVEFDIPLVGQLAVFTPGTVTPTGDRTVALVGQSAVFTAGNVSPAMAIALAGQAASFTPGTMTPGLALALLGQAATSATGTLSPSLSVALTGQQAFFTAGSVIAPMPVITGIFTLTSADVTLIFTGNSTGLAKWLQNFIWGW